MRTENKDRKSAKKFLKAEKQIMEKKIIRSVILVVPRPSPPRDS